MKRETMWKVLMVLLAGAIVLLAATYVQMRRCAQVIKIIDEKGGPAAVCEWACMACSELKAAGVIG